MYPKRLCFIVASATFLRPKNPRFITCCEAFGVATRVGCWKGNQQRKGNVAQPSHHCYRKAVDYRTLVVVLSANQQASRSSDEMPPKSVTNRSRRKAPIVDSEDAAKSSGEEHLRSDDFKETPVPKATKDNNQIVAETDDKKESKPSTSKTRGRKKSLTDDNTTTETTKSSTKKAKVVKSSEESTEGSSKSRTKAKTTEQRITERDPLPKLWHAKEGVGDGKLFKLLSWNVDGLRAVLRNHPNALPDLAKQHNPDLICLQETKLQEMHVTDPKLELQGYLLDKEGYDSYWSCSTAKKGYSGTAVFAKRTGASGGGVKAEKKVGLVRIRERCVYFAMSSILNSPTFCAV